jgi:uncharacterized protein with FMN-binding domain
MAQRMSRGLVALSSTVVAAIYCAGYLMTQGADAGLAASESAPAPIIAAAGPPAPAGVPTAVLAAPRSFIPPTALPTGPPTAGSSGQSPGGVTYRDGTYQGSGTSRRGGFVVAVTIQGGRIANVTFTQVTTQYPVSRVAALPGQVVARQSAQVDRVSGATYSVQAFQQAVQQALAKASIGGATAAAPSAGSGGAGA